VWQSAVAVVALVGAVVVGCSDAGAGGDRDGAPSVRAFCAGLGDFEQQVDAVDPADDLPGYIEGMQAAARDLDERGVPGEVPDDARRGFEVTMERIEALSPGASLDELSELGDVSDDDQASLDALDDYISRSCPDLGDDPSGDAGS
jgi:hypothetical protein